MDFHSNMKNGMSHLDLHCSHSYLLWSAGGGGCGQMWSDVAKVSCILRHQGVQQILAYS